MSTTESPPGTLLGGRYLLSRPLGAGASATVYLAEDRSLRREVAVKVLRTGLAHDDAFLRRFRAEAVAVAGLNHPHVLRVFDWGEEGEDAWLVTEYLAGGSVRDLLDLKGRLPLEHVVSIGTQAADGLAYAHERGFVHRDVKPSNLLFDDAGRVRITDFGVARALAEAAWTEPTGGLIGTVRYTSPEQAQGHAVDGKADVYSLALVLYECASGELPFAADSQVATLNARIGAAPPTHPALGELGPVLRDAMSPDPAARIDAAELFARLTELARTLPEPQPLRGPRHSSSVGFRPPTARQLTGEHRVVAGPRTQGSRRDRDTTSLGARSAADATVVGTVAAADVLAPRGADATVVGGLRSDPTSVATVPTVEAPAPPLPPEEGIGVRRRRRRWPLAFVAIVVAIVGSFLALTAGGARPIPTFRMPSLLGLSVAQANSLLQKDHVSVTVDRGVTSIRWRPGQISAQRPRPGAVVKEQSHVHAIVSLGLPPVAIPSVVGKSCAGAITALEAVHFKASCPPGLAEYSTTIPAGQVLGVFAGNAENTVTAPYGTHLGIAISKGRPPIQVPNVVGEPGLQAVSALSQAGLVPQISHVFSRTVHAGNVISISPSTTAQPGKPVAVVISRGAPTTVPSLGHANLHTAESIIANAGLVVVAVHGATTSTTWTTQPPAGSVVADGSAVILYGS